MADVIHPFGLALILMLNGILKCAHTQSPTSAFLFNMMRAASFSPFPYATNAAVKPFLFAHVCLILDTPTALYLVGTTENHTEMAHGLFHVHNLKLREVMIEMGLNDLGLNVRNLGGIVFRNLLGIVCSTSKDIICVSYSTC